MENDILHRRRAGLEPLPRGPYSPVLPGAPYSPALVKAVRPPVLPDCPYSPVLPGGPYSPTLAWGSSCVDKHSQHSQNTIPSFLLIEPLIDSKREGRGERKERRSDEGGREGGKEREEGMEGVRG